MIPKQLQDKRIRFCRIKRGTKKPFEKEWTKKPYFKIEIEKFLPKENYGILCGYGDLTVIDCDEEEIQLIIENMLPETFRVKTGGGGMHNYFFIKDIEKKIILEVDGKHLGEVQSHGTQVVGPNSIHPNKNKYEVINDVPIKEITKEDLLSVISNYIKEVKESEDNINYEREINSEIDELDVTDIWSTSSLKKHGSEYYGEHPIHGSDGGSNFWVNPLKNTWHCFRCDSGGGPLSAIAVKHGIINCSDAKRGNLRGNKALEAINIARDDYGLKTHENGLKPQIDMPEDKVDVIWSNEIEDYEVKDKEWIIENIIPSRSIGVWTGKRGSFKTFLILNAAFCVSEGKEFLGKYKTKKGKVIYLDKENGIYIMKNRVRIIRQGLNLEKNQNVGFICFSHIKLDKTSDLIEIERIIQENKPSLLIVDTYRRAIAFEENDAGATSQLFVDLLRPLAEKHGISIILIHHDRKGEGSGDEMDMIRGSSDLANYADFILKNERRGKKLILKQLKMRNAPEIVPQEVKVSTNETEYMKFTSEGAYERETLEQKAVKELILWIIKEKIDEFKTADAKEVIFAHGMGKTTMQNALINLQSQAIIEKIGERGKYKVINKDVQLNL
jgi:hypothetical protein